MSGSTGSAGKGSSKSKTRVQIPEFLRPFLEQSAGVAGSALGNLQAGIGDGQNLVAGFQPAQEFAQMLGINRAIDPNSAFATATGTASEIAQGGAAPGSDVLSMISQGGGIDPAALARLQQGTQGGALPGMGQIQQMLGQTGVPQAATDALTQTAQGNFLFGGEGFDQAVQAAMRAARPGILSTFGRAGAGGASSGLAQQAIAQSGIDAFARQFGQERQNQLNAAGNLGQLGLQGQGQQADIAGLAAQLGLSGRGQELGAATNLAQIGGDQRLRAALGLGDLGLGQSQQRLAAAGQLPGLATADINLLSGIGGQQQDLEQQRIDAPLNAQLQLLNAALGGVPISSLLGQNQSGRTTDFSMAFGG